MNINQRKIISVAVSMALSTMIGAAIAQDAKVIEQKTKKIDGVTYKFEKTLDTDGSVKETVKQAGRNIAALPQVKRQLATSALNQRLAKAKDSETIAVNIALVTPEIQSSTETESGSIEIKNGRIVNQTHNGSETSDQALIANSRVKAERKKAERKARIEAQKEIAKAFADRHRLRGHKQVQVAIEAGAETITAELTAAQIRKLLSSGDASIAGIELAFPVKDLITSAMQDTNITNYALPYSNLHGSGIGIYMTESGCADETGRTNYDRLAGSQTNHSQNVFGIMRAVSPSSYIYCRGGAVLPQATDLDGVNGNPAIRVINRSNGGNQTTSYSTLDRDWDNLAYNNNIAIFNAAGNNDTGSDIIVSPAKGLNVMAVGNYNDANDTINSSSCFVDNELGNNKPEFSAPGTNITAGGFTMTGTSMAAPHAAAFAADMMSGLSVYLDRPYVVYASMIGGATDAITGGVDKVGQGGIDFLSTYYDGYTYYYNGNNASFSSFDAADGATDGYIDKIVNITNTSQKVRVAIAWLNRGTYTYDHKADAHPIGQDLDLTVLSPTGAYVGGSSSFDNQYEVVNFVPSVTGNYKIRVRRYANRDTSADFRMGLKINFYN
ncbi:MAG: S8 family serine peptidase [Pseudomonadota bacterium]